MAKIIAENSVEFTVDKFRGNTRLTCRDQYLLFDPVDVHAAARAIHAALAREDGTELLAQAVGPQLGVMRQKGGIGLKRIYGKADVAFIHIPDDVAGQIAAALTKEAGSAWL